MTARDKGKGGENQGFEAQDRGSNSHSCYCYSVTQSCPTLWPHGLQHARPPCPHHLLEFAKVHVHCIGDAHSYVDLLGWCLDRLYRQSKGALKVILSLFSFFLCFLPSLLFFLPSSISLSLSSFLSYPSSTSLLFLCESAPFLLYLLGCCILRLHITSDIIQYLSFCLMHFT